MSSSNCCFLTCIHISQDAGQVVWYSYLFKNFPQFAVIHTVKDFGIVDKAEVDVFLELSCLFDDPVDVGNLISGSSAFSIFQLEHLEVHGSQTVEAWLGDFEHYFPSVWDQCSCAEVWAFFGIALLWDWNFVLYFEVIKIYLKFYFSLPFYVIDISLVFFRYNIYSEVSQSMYAWVLNCFSRVRLFVTLWIVAYS